MKTERWFVFVLVLLVVLVAIFVVVSRLSHESVTGNIVGFTCPDGSVVDSEENCLSEGFFNNLVVEPESLSVEVGVGDQASQTFAVRNNNEFSVEINCGFNEQPWLEPEVTCLTYDAEEGFVSSSENSTLESGKVKDFTVRVYTYEDALLIQNGSKFYFTTHSGTYTREIVLSAWADEGEREEHRIPLSIVVVD